MTREEDHPRSKASENMREKRCFKGYPGCNCMNTFRDQFLGWPPSPQKMMEASMADDKTVKELQAHAGAVEVELERAVRENKRLHELLEEKGRELEYAWKTEREAAQRVSEAELKVQDLQSRFSRERWELQGRIAELEDELETLNERVTASQNIANLVKLERDNIRLREDLRACEDRVGAMLRAAERMLHS